MAAAMTSAGFDPAQLGRDEETLRRVGTFVELHVEQGRHLVDVGPHVGGDRVSGQRLEGGGAHEVQRRRRGDDADVMPRLRQIGGHASAHVAKADEADPCHAGFSYRPVQLPGRFSTKAVMPSF